MKMTKGRHTRGSTWVQTCSCKSGRLGLVWGDVWVWIPVDRPLTRLRLLSAFCFDSAYSHPRQLFPPALPARLRAALLRGAALMSPGAAPLRVVSLLPSATDVVVCLGLTHLLVGRSHECDAPGVSEVAVCSESKLGECAEMSSTEVDAAAQGASAALAEASHLGGQASRERACLEWGLAVYRTNLDALFAARPTVLLTQLQPGLSHQAATAYLARLLGPHPPPRLLTLTAASVQECLHECLLVADACGAHQQGLELAARWRWRLAEVSSRAAAQAAPPRVAVLQWTEPTFAASGWVPELLRACGASDALQSPPGAAARQLSARELSAAAPEVLLFALCGLSRAQAAAQAPQLRRAMGEEAWAALPCVRERRVFAVDAVRLFSRSSTLAETAELLEVLCHPEAGHLGERGADWRRIDAAVAEDVAEAGARSRDAAGERELAYV